MDPESSYAAGDDHARLVRARFDEIYAGGGWGGLGSGPGSLPHNAQPYVGFVKRLLRRGDVRTVVDVGCGDWQMWPSGTFDGIEKYVGYDVVESVVERNSAVYGSPRIEFHLADATRIRLPQADLLLCKEVLQHLPNQVAHTFLTNVLASFRTVVVCDDISMESSSSWRRVVRRMLDLVIPPPVRVNMEIEPGGYRPIDYHLPRFADLPLARCLDYESLAPPRCKTTKVIWSTRCG